MGGGSKTSEFDVIARYFAPLSKGEPGAFSLTDDAASLALPEGRLVVSADTLVAGVHFPVGTEAALIAVKLLGVNLSDMAAMGAKPFAYTLAAALPEEVGGDWLEAFANSLAAEQETYNIPLIGGDTVATPGALTLTVNMLGTVEEGGEMLRSSARPGDHIYVSGTIGDAALGLMALNGELGGQTVELIDRYQRPRPRVELGRRLAGLAHGLVDVSDGLVADLGHICAASGVSASLQADKVPLSLAARAALESDPRLISAVLAGGDDYELLFTAPPELALSVDRLSRDLDLPLTLIGEVVDGKPQVRVTGKDGNEIELAEKGYRHTWR